MADLASLIHKHNVSQEDALEILEYVKKEGSEKAGVEAWVKSLTENLEDCRFQLKTQGQDVSVVTHVEP
jgi:hypothetical protein